MRTRRTQRMAMSLTVAAGMTTLLASCGDDDSGDAAASLPPGCTAPPTPAPELTGPAALFDLDGIADVMATGEDSGSVTIDAQADGTLEDLAIKFQSVVEDAGFQVDSNDAEADEAEVFFKQGDIAAGQVRMRSSDCAGKIDIRISVLDNPLVLPTST